MKGKLEEANCQKQKLQEEVTALREKVETARTDVVQKFKISQLFIESCADYFGTRFDDCLKQVISAFPELDLSEIPMDTPELVTPTRMSSLMMMTVPPSRSFLPRLTAVLF